MVNIETSTVAIKKTENTVCITPSLINSPTGYSKFIQTIDQLHHELGIIKNANLKSLNAKGIDIYKKGMQNIGVFSNKENCDPISIIQFRDTFIRNRGNTNTNSKELLLQDIEVLKTLSPTEYGQYLSLISYDMSQEPLKAKDINVLRNALQIFDKINASLTDSELVQLFKSSYSFKDDKGTIIGMDLARLIRKNRKIKEINSNLEEINSTLNQNKGLTRDQVRDIQKAIFLILLNRKDTNNVNEFRRNNTIGQLKWDGFYGASIKKYLTEITGVEDLKEALPILLRIFKEELLGDMPKLTLNDQNHYGFKPDNIVENDTNISAPKETEKPEEIQDIEPIEKEFSLNELSDIYSDLKFVNELILNKFMVASHSILKKDIPIHQKKEEAKAFNLKSYQYHLSKKQIVSLQKALYFHMINSGDTEKAKQFKEENMDANQWDGKEGPSLIRHIIEYSELNRNRNIFESLMCEIREKEPTLKKVDTSILAVTTGKDGMHIGFNPAYFSKDSGDIINKINQVIMSGEFNEYIGTDEVEEAEKNGINIDKRDCWDFKTSIVGHHPESRTKVKKDLPEFIQDLKNGKFKIGTSFHTQNCSLSGSGSSHWGILVKDANNQPIIIHFDQRINISNPEHFFRNVPKIGDRNYKYSIKNKHINFEDYEV